MIAHPTPGLWEALGDAGIYVHRDDIDAWQAALRTLVSPDAWQAAWLKATQRAAELDPVGRPGTWCTVVEALAASS